MSSSQLTSSYFSEGWLNHQPDESPVSFDFSPINLFRSPSPPAPCAAPPPSRSSRAAARCRGPKTPGKMDASPGDKSDFTREIDGNLGFYQPESQISPGKVGLEAAKMINTCGCIMKETGENRDFASRKWWFFNMQNDRSEKERGRIGNDGDLTWKNFWLVVWNINFIFPLILGINHPNWLSYFSEGFKPPTSYFCRKHLFRQEQLLDSEE